MARKQSYYNPKYTERIASIHSSLSLLKLYVPYPNQKNKNRKKTKKKLANHQQNG